MDIPFFLQKSEIFMNDKVNEQATGQEILKQDVQNRAADNRITRVMVKIY